MSNTTDPTDTTTICAYCGRTECMTECCLAWELRHNVGRAKPSATWTGQTFEEFDRCLSRGLLTIGPKAVTA